jgi:hypothetical protein
MRGMAGNWSAQPLANAGQFSPYVTSPKSRPVGDALPAYSVLNTSGVQRQIGPHGGVHAAVGDAFVLPHI